MKAISNNISKIGWIGLMLLCIASCNDVMDTQPFDKFSEDVVWSSKANADAFVFTTYHKIFRDRWVVYMEEEEWTNNNVNYNGSGFTRELITRDNDFNFNQFTEIRRCNLIIEKAAASTGLSETDKKELVAEGKFLRASIYYYLAKRFGIVVWVDRVLQPEEENYKFATTPDVKTTYGYIIKDLEDAARDMAEEALSGRASRYGAYALLSEVCLQAAA